MLLEQVAEGLDHRCGVLALDRQPEQLLVTCQVAHVEDGGEATVDTVWRMAEVHRPDAARTKPVQLTALGRVRCAPTNAELAAEEHQLGSGQFGMLGSE